MTESDRKLIRELIERNRYLTLATTDGSEPWIAPLEYVADDDLNLFFFSPEETTHAMHIEKRETVAVAIYDAVQPEYEPASTIRIAGLQAQARALKLEPPYPPIVDKQIGAWKLSMPPYAAYKIVPLRWYLPVLKDGVNERLEVDMS